MTLAVPRTWSCADTTDTCRLLFEAVPQFRSKSTALCAPSGDGSSRLTSFVHSHAVSATMNGIAILTAALLTLPGVNSICIIDSTLNHHDERLIVGTVRLVWRG